MLLVLPFVLLISACTTTDTGFEISQKGRYAVTEELSGIEFKAVLEGVYAEYSFTKPLSVTGLTAVTADGVGYTLSYGGIKTQLCGASVDIAADFSAALELLRSLGEHKNGVIHAQADALYAEATINENNISEISFYNGKQKRIYKIITEA